METTNVIKERVTRIYSEILKKDEFKWIYSEVSKKNHLVFIISLLIITSYIIIFVISYIFRIDSLSYFTMDSLSPIFPDINSYSSNLDTTRFDKSKFVNILSLIVSVLSSILAIVLSLTFIGIERISEKYSPFIIEMYKNDKRTKNVLYAFVFVIVASTLLILTADLISSFALLVYSLGLTFSYVLCFSVLISYYYFVIDIINPHSFASILEKKILNYAKDEKRKEAEQLITSIGDITINSLKREEQDISEVFTDKIYSIFFICFKELKNFSYLNVTLNSYQRILKYCLKNQNELRYTIIDRYAEIPELFNWLTDADRKKTNKFSEEITSQYLEYLDKLYNLNKLIIDENDFKAFKEEINSISTRFVNDPKETKKEIQLGLMLTDLNILEAYSNPEIATKTKRIEILLDDLERNFSNSHQYLTILEKMDGLFQSVSELAKTKEDEENVLKSFEDLRTNLFRFFLDSNFHKTFFILGAYCLFNRKEMDLEPDKYLRELWLHTESGNPYVINLNQVPVTSNIEFLFNILFWGGNYDSSWHNRYSFKAFHDSMAYLYKYSILVLTHLRERKNEELTIQIHKHMEREELESKHEFLQKFIRETDNLIEYCDEFIKEAEKWRFLFPNKKKEVLVDIESGESTIKEIPTKEQFENTKVWLFIKNEEFKKQIETIKNYLPIDNEKEKNCKKEINESYEKSSEIHKAVIINEFGVDTDKDFHFVSINYSKIMPKDCFLKTSYIICSSIWFDYGRVIAFKEIMYFISQVNELKENIDRIPVYSKNTMEVYSNIESSINQLKNNGYNPSTIFIPLDILSEFRKESSNKESEIYKKFLYHEQIFKYDSSLTLEIIDSSEFIKFKDIIILDKKYSNWVFKPTEEGKRLHIEMEEREDKPANINLTAKTIVNLKIEDYSSVKIIEIPKDETMS